MTFKDGCIVTLLDCTFTLKGSYRACKCEGIQLRRFFAKPNSYGTGNDFRQTET